MNPDISIIMPSCNRYPLNLLSLASLERQTFPMANMEVILIDDASTDDTPLLRNRQSPYPFRYIRNERNQGRSRTRNMGIEAANGRILIFLDAEFVVDRHFVQRHHESHETGLPLVVTGKHKRRLYSVLYPQFNKNQFHRFRSVVRASPRVRKRLMKRCPSAARLSGAWGRRISRLRRPVQLLTPRDIRSFAAVPAFSTPSRFYTKQIASRIQQGFLLPWIACNGFHSVSKERAEAVGGFDERFAGHGLEDYEYGFRLYKSGVTFSCHPEIQVYHQEHPASRNRSAEGNRNLVRFQQKHPCLDVALLSLTRLGMYNYSFMNRVLREQQTIETGMPAMFDSLQSGLLAMLHSIPQLQLKKKPVTRLFHASGIASDRNWKRRFLMERDALTALGFPSLKRLTDLLIRL